MKKLFKKIGVSFLSFIILFGGVFTLGDCSDRSEILRVYVPGEYITQEVLDGFSDFYFEETGKNITVVKKEFDTNETMYTMVATKHQDFDIICPSDYMVERMINEGLLQKVNPTIMAQVEEAIAGDLNQNGDFVNLIKDSFDPNFEYACPYMWGTMGTLYYLDADMSEVTKAEVDASDKEKSSWTNLFDVSERKIYMKDSERDSYTVALFNHYAEQLAELSEHGYENEAYQNLLNSIFILGDNFSEKLEAAKNSLQNQKQYVYDYESDEGKDDLLTSKGAQGYYGAFWSCDAGYIMAEYNDEDDTTTYNENFRYIVPKEGSNVWVDSFCISKYAGNKEAAELFMLYICTARDEEDTLVAFNCMDYAGCTSAVYAAAEDYYNYLNPADPDDPEADYNEEFLECSPAFRSNFLSLMFPYKNISVEFEYEDENGETQLDSYEIENPLRRCKIMRDLGAKASDDLLKMWTNLRRYTSK